MVAEVHGGDSHISGDADVDRLRRWTTSLRATNRAPKTARNYEAVTRTFLSFLRTRGLTVATAPENVLALYIEYLVALGRGFEPETVKVYVKVARRFLRWLGDVEPAGLPRFNLADPANMPRGRRSREKQEIPRPILEKYVQAALQWRLTISTPLILLAATGMRVGALVQLQPDWIDFSPECGTFLFGLPDWAEKTRTARTVPLHPKLAPWFLRFLRTRTDPRRPLFESRAGRGLSKSSLQHYVQRIGRMVGYPLHSHLFRHQYATLLDQVDVRGKRKSVLLGHANHSMEDLYTHVSLVQSVKDLAKMDVSWLLPYLS